MGRQIRVRRVEEVRVATSKKDPATGDASVKTDSQQDDEAQPVEGAETDGVEDAEFVDLENEGAEEADDPVALTEPEEQAATEPEGSDPDEESADADPVPEGDEPAYEKAIDDYPPVPPPPPVRAKASRQWVPMAVAGVVVAGLGFAAGTTWNTGTSAETDAAITALQDQLQAVETRTDALASSVEAFPAPPDLGPIEISIGEAEAEIGSLSRRLTEVQTAAQVALAEATGALDERLTAIELQPADDGGVSQTAIDALDRKIAALEAELEEQRTLVSALTADAEARFDQMRQEAEAEGLRAEAEARQTMARASIAAIQAAIETGAPYAAQAQAFEEVTGQSLPPTLAALADQGVPTSTSLADAFPQAARIGLAEARRVGLAEDGAGLSGFLRDQLSVRSVEPREGADVDAVLSRMEAAVAAGRLTDALAEAEALPTEVTAVMADWLGLAADRRTALSEAAALAVTDTN